MVKEIILTPEELFFLGTALDASHVDYAYIAAMKDIQLNKEASAQDVRRGLTDKNYLAEDFSGEIEIDENVKKLLNPIFFGAFESMVSVCTVQEKSSVNSIRIHSDGEMTVMVLMLEDGLHIACIEEQDIRYLVFSLMPEGYVEKEIPEEAQLDRSKISRVIACKNTSAGKSAIVRVFFEYEGLMCKDAGDTIEIMHPGNFCEEVFGILKGAEYGLS